MGDYISWRSDEIDKLAYLIGAFSSQLMVKKQLIHIDCSIRLVLVGAVGNGVKRKGVVVNMLIANPHSLNSGIAAHAPIKRR